MSIESIVVSTWDILRLTESLVGFGLRVRVVTCEWVTVLDILLLYDLIVSKLDCCGRRLVFILHGIILKLTSREFLHVFFILDCYSPSLHDFEQSPPLVLMICNWPSSTRLWFETKNDLQRVIGQVSKAICIDRSIDGRMALSSLAINYWSTIHSLTIVEWRGLICCRWSVSKGTLPCYLCFWLQE